MPGLLKVPRLLPAILCLLALAGVQTAAAQSVCWDCEDDLDKHEHWLDWGPPVGWESGPCGIHFNPDSGWCLFNHEAGCFQTDSEEEPDTDALLALVAAEMDQGLRELLAAHPDRLTASNDGKAIGFLDCEGNLAFWYTLRESQVAQARDRQLPKPQV